LEHDILIDMSRALGRIESRLDGQDRILGELQVGSKALVQLTNDFAAHVQADARTAGDVSELVDRPIRRRRAALKWGSGLAATAISAFLVLVIKGCG